VIDNSQRTEGYVLLYTSGEYGGGADQTYSGHSTATLFAGVTYQDIKGMIVTF